MRHIPICCIALLLAASPALGEEPAVVAASKGADGVASAANESEGEKAGQSGKAEEAAKVAKEAAKEAEKEAEKAAEKKAVEAPKGDKVLSGMSIVGNDEAPKSLVIVPWKSSELGHTLDLSKDLDDGRGPVDKDVFMRELAYYGIRSGSAETEPSGSK